MVTRRPARPPPALCLLGLVAVATWQVLPSRGLCHPGTTAMSSLLDTAGSCFALVPQSSAVLRTAPHWRRASTASSPLLAVGGSAAGVVASRQPSVSRHGTELWLLPSGFVTTAVANRVSNRVLLVFMMRHSYFLAMATSIVQLAVYVVLLWNRARRGLVTGSMWKFAAQNPWLLASFGACEGAFLPLVFFAAARLPGALVQVLNQMLIPFTVLFSTALLSRRYTKTEMLGVSTVLAGVILLAVLPADVAAAMASAGHSRGRDILLCITAYALLAMGMVIKEIVLTKYTKENPDTPEQGFDYALFIASATFARTLVVLGGWPIFNYIAAPGASIWSNVVDGLNILQQPFVFSLAGFYWVSNTILGITAMLLVQKSTAACVVLANVVALPLSTLLFCCRLPVLEPEPFKWRLIASLALVVFGNVLYKWRTILGFLRRS